MNEASAQAGDGTNASREIQQLQLLSASGLDQADPALLVTTSWPSWVIVHLEKSSVVHALGGTGGQTVVLNLTVKFVGSKPRTAEREREREHQCFLVLRWSVSLVFHSLSLSFLAVLTSRWWLVT